jgi:hypothetical protein
MPGFEMGKKAVVAARPACELSKWKAPSYLDTLATANAEAGQFDEAVKYGNIALADAGFRKSDGAKAKKRLKRYKQKKPFWE